MNQNAMFKPALIAGVLMGIFSAVPPLSFFNCFCCAWVIAGGVLAAHLYVKNSLTVVTLGTGAALGLLTGVIGAIVDTLFSIPLQILMRRMLAGFTDQFGRMLSDLPNLTPELRDIMTSALKANAGPTVIGVIFGGIVNIVVFSIMATLGGVLGVAVFEKRKVGDRMPLAQPPINLPPPPGPPEPPEQ
jgi:uncharacterized protein YqgC (DUF456 family)